MIPLILILGLGAIALKVMTTVSAPTPGSAAELQANVLPSNFAEWIVSASPRQKDAVRQILIFQLRHALLSQGRPDPGPDPLTWPPSEDYPTSLIMADPASSSDTINAYRESDMLYRQRFNLAPGQPAEISPAGYALPAGRDFRTSRYR